MIVVSDTSPITSLLQIGREHILPKLFLRVLIPEAVRAELDNFHPKLPSFLEVIKVRDQRIVAQLAASLDIGEAEAIVLAEEQSANLVLIDDFLARTLALSRGLPVIGLLGVLLKAKRAGLIEVLTPVIADLETVAGFRISPKLRADLLREAGE
jgi:hypothetical protein